MEPTQTQPQASPDALSRGREVYDQIMAGINPELTTEGLATLGDKYVNETPEQAQARREKYDADFAEYDKQYAAYMTDLATKTHSLQRQVRASAEQDERAVEEQELNNLESSMSSL